MPRHVGSAGAAPGSILSNTVLRGATWRLTCTLRRAERPEPGTAAGARASAALRRCAFAVEHAHMQLADTERVEGEADQLFDQIPLLVQQLRWHQRVIALLPVR